MFVAWVLFPLLLIALSAGCGLLLEGLAGRRLPGLLLAPSGLAVIVVASGILTSRGETADLAAPAVVALALAGFWRARRLRAGFRAGPSLRSWPFGAAALGAFVFYGAPVFLSGHPTFAGYMKLDDTATWMAFVDRLMDHGRDLSGLAPSSYQRTLEVNLPSGYPVGAFLPLGIGTKLTGADVAWLVQPYMATLAALLALCLAWLTEPLLSSRATRAWVAFLAAQPALLFGYSLWGGVKEVAVAWAIALLASLATFFIGRNPDWRSGVPTAFAAAALLGVAGVGGLAWMLPALLPLTMVIWPAGGVRMVLQRLWPVAAGTAVLFAPALLAGPLFSPLQGGLTQASELGNLLRPLDVAQFGGVWITGDFRLAPSQPGVTSFILVLAAMAAVVGAWLAWRRRSSGLLIYLATAGIGSLLVFVSASPWVAAKALASGSPAFVLLALAGAASIAAIVERVVGVTILVVVAAGVLWSNALAYHDVDLAPYGQLKELEEIGSELDGHGPTLMTEYQPYGVRHFLRAGDAEGASELRARRVPLVSGGELYKGEWADTDQIDLRALLTYQTLVLRRSPAQSRPPSVYSLVRKGRYYEVWQRLSAPEPSTLRHLPLGDFEQPGIVPRCADIRAFARAAGPGGALVAAARGPNVVASLAAASKPADWTAAEGRLSSDGHGTARLRVNVPDPDRYAIYLEGGVHGGLTLTVDGRSVGAVEDQLNESGQFLSFGSVGLTPGPHSFALTSSEDSLQPGAGGTQPIGPLVLEPETATEPPLIEVPASRAQTLCGERLDWLETLP